MVLFEGSSTECTHVLARHMQEEISIWGLNNGKTLVTAFWVWECADKNQLWPLDDPVNSNTASEALVWWHTHVTPY